MSFDQFDRVKTNLGPGTVVYKRMKAPDYAEVEVYSVRLDSPPKPYHTHGAGTIFPAEDVRAFAL
jgi:hypothetical protein